MSRFVRFERFGSPDVLQVVDIEPPHPGPGQVRVQILAAGLNPVDYKVFHGGPAAEAYGAVLPSGAGNDFAGRIDEVGKGVTEWSAGDAVLGGARNYALADFVVIDAYGALTRKPENLRFEVAGALDVVGRTAWANLEAVPLTADDTVFVSAAAGGVGILTVQLAKRTGATVIGSASEANHEYLTSLGVIPVAYGDGIVDRIRELAPGGVTAAIDNHGPESIDVALELGVAEDRINSIASQGYRGVKNAGAADASVENLARVAQLVADGELDLPIEAIYPLERVREAYERLETGHGRGKIVVVTE